MVELKSCGSLVNAGALCGIEAHEMVKGESNNNDVNVAEICAELRREREKNAKLMERISILEAQIKLRDSNRSFLTLHGQGSCITATERSQQKFKRQKTGSSPKETDEVVSVNGETAPRIKQDKANSDNQLVNWMRMDEALLMQVDISKDDYVAACDDTDDSDEENENEETNTNVDLEKTEVKENSNHREGNAEGTSSISFSGKKSEPEVELPCSSGLQTCEKKGRGKTADDHFKEMASQGLRNGSYVKKPPKIAFCPKEVKRMMESEVLQLKNAQSHTIRVGKNDVAAKVRKANKN